MDGHVPPRASRTYLPQRRRRFRWSCYGSESRRLGGGNYLDVSHAF